MSFRKVLMSYGSKGIELQVPEENFSGFIEPKKMNEKKEVFAEMQSAVEELAGFADAVKGKKVCCLVEDETRATFTKELLQAVCPKLRSASFVQFIIGVMHNPFKQELEQFSTNFIIILFEHDDPEVPELLHVNIL